MPGHIGIGAPGALREYMIENLNLYAKAPANQFAAKLSTGGGSYDDLQNWSYFAMEDWRAGIGKKDPEAGGTLYSELETRYPNRLTMPNALSLHVAEAAGKPLNFGWQPGRDVYPNSTLPIGTGQTVQKIAHGFNGLDSDYVYVTLWLDGDPDNIRQIKVSLYSSTTSSGRQVPNTLLDSQSFYPDAQPGARPYGVLFAYTTSASTYYHVVLEPVTAGQTVTLPVTTSGIVAADEFSTYNGSTWTGGYTSAAFLHGFTVENFLPGPQQNVTYFPTNGYLYMVDGNYKVWRKTDDDTSEWTIIETLTDYVTDVCVVGNELWFALGDSTNLVVMDSVENFTDGGVVADLLLLANGYVWRSVANDVYYTNDGSTWTGPIEITWDGFAVRGMAAMGDYIYCATDEALYYIGYGEEVVYVTSWASIDATNGRGMINHHGTLFIPVQQSLFRFDGQSMIPVGLDMGEGLPNDRVGTIAGLVSLNNWLVAYIYPSRFTDRATVWAYNDQGWHYLAGFPYGMRPVWSSYDINSRRLYFADQYCHIWQLPTEDSANFNNISSYPTPKMPAGWMETDWFFGNLYEVSKDIESLYVSGDGIDSTHTVKLYWMDDDSTKWEYLGTVATGRSEVRWSDYSTRPNTRQIKVGVLIETQSDDAPVVRVIRMKYHPMVSDWFRWSFPILCSDYQELLGPDVSTYTRAQQAAHLDEMIKRVPPFILRDLDGNQYEVKVMGCQIQAVNYRYKNPDGAIPAEAVDFDYIYSITLEQIRSEGYEA